MALLSQPSQGLDYKPEPPQMALTCSLWCLLLSFETRSLYIALVVRELYREPPAPAYWVPGLKAMLPRDTWLQGTLNKVITMIIQHVSHDFSLSLIPRELLNLLVQPAESTGNLGGGGCSLTGTEVCTRCPWETLYWLLHGSSKYWFSDMILKLEGNR